MIPVETRLRRAIHLADPALVHRIITSHPTCIQNPDYEDKSNTSLHLAASLGHLEIVRILIAAGHESSSTSLNTLFETPLHLACANSHPQVALVLLQTFPQTASWQTRAGLDALMLASRAGLMTLLPPLLAASPGSIHAHDADGNTALHYASAAGELKAARTLLGAGASPAAMNAYSWTPVAYSKTGAAEAYFKTLVAEVERRRVEAGREKIRAGAVRLVSDADSGKQSPLPMLNTNDLGNPMVDDGPISAWPTMNTSPVENRKERVGTPVRERVHTPIRERPGDGGGWPFASPERDT